jgi:glutamate carboxypeptidase
MDNLLSWTLGQQAAIVRTIRQMVECESPSDDPAGIARFNELLADFVSGDGTCRRIGTNLICTFSSLPGRRKTGQLMALGHADTVWPLGTLRGMPFRAAEGRLWGPGVLDMKAGLAFFLFAMRGLRELEIPVGHKVILQVNSDEAQPRGAGAGAGHGSDRKAENGA